MRARELMTYGAMTAGALAFGGAATAVQYHFFPVNQQEIMEQRNAHHEDQDIAPLAIGLGALATLTFGWAAVVSVGNEKSSDQQNNITVTTYDAAARPEEAA